MTSSSSSSAWEGRRLGGPSALASSSSSTLSSESSASECGREGCPLRSKKKSKESLVESTGELVVVGAVAGGGVSFGET